MLREDLLPFAGNAEAPSAEELAQVKSVTEKLAVYSHLFNEQAIKEFAQLSNKDDEWDERADDNNREGLSLEDGYDGTAERNLQAGLGDELLDLLSSLETDLNDSVAALEKEEINAAWDLATWL